jgi:hypothetical protein
MKRCWDVLGRWRGCGRKAGVKGTPEAVALQKQEEGPSGHPWEMWVGCRVTTTDPQDLGCVYVPLLSSNGDTPLPHQAGARLDRTLRTLTAEFGNKRLG